MDASEYRVLDSLYNEKGISAELLNILTYACLKSGPNVSFRLANKILHDWLQHGVKPVVKLWNTWTIGKRPKSRKESSMAVIIRVSQLKRARIGLKINQK
ncbi:DnaD domain protein [Lactobacillus sp. R2/2]|nr:DnaD domain protein [Lactobacillus sp. R2/2]